jgi:hypothetical protein
MALTRAEFLGSSIGRTGTCAKPRLANAFWGGQLSALAQSKLIQAYFSSATARAECLQQDSAQVHQRYLTHTPDPCHHLWYSSIAVGRFIESLSMIMSFGPVNRCFHTRETHTLARTRARALSLLLAGTHDYPSALAMAGGMVFELDSSRYTWKLADANGPCDDGRKVGTTSIRWGPG